MMGDLTINVWMILAVILSVGIIAILMFSIYRGIQRCHHRIDDQDDSFEKIDGRINSIYSEIINIRLDQANVKAAQAIKVEDVKAQPAVAPPIHIYQQSPPHQQCIYPTLQSIAQPVPYPYVQQIQQTQPQVVPQMQYWTHQEQQQTVQPQTVQPQTVQPQTVQPQISRQAQNREPQEQQGRALERELPNQPQYPTAEYFQQQRQDPVQLQRPEPVQQQRPEPVQQQRPEPVQQQAPQPIQMSAPENIQEQEPQRAQQNSQNQVGVKAPVYHQTRIPTIGFTEFQLPEEYDFEEEINYPSRPEPRNEPLVQSRPEPRNEPLAQQRQEARPQQRPDPRQEARLQQRPEPRQQAVTQQRPDPRQEARPQQRPDPRQEARPQTQSQPRPADITPKEKVTPSKFNSLNDGISRTGKRYSEEELANRILD